MYQLAFFSWPMSFYYLQGLSTKREKWNRIFQGVWNLSTRAYCSLNFMHSSYAQKGGKCILEQEKNLEIIQFKTHFTNE